MATVSLSGHNARLSYSLDGAHVARLRCRSLSISYGVNSEESAARRTRAFYPHLRVQGSFAMTFDFIHWDEFHEGMNWFRNYGYAILSSRLPSPMLVRLNARNFLRFGVPVNGIAFGDHVGSMVFSPTITFVSVSDPRDAKSAILQTSQASHSDLPKDSIEAKWFYPDSELNHPGALQQYIYDLKATSAEEQAGGVQGIINGPGSGGIPAPPINTGF